MTANDTSDPQNQPEMMLSGGEDGQALRRREGGIEAFSPFSQ